MAEIGIEPGPAGFMPEDPGVLGAGLERHDLTLVGGVCSVRSTTPPPGTR